MEPNRPSVSRDTRLLFAVILISVAMLWVLARIRFPDRPPTPKPGSAGSRAAGCRRRLSTTLPLRWLSSSLRLQESVIALDVRRQSGRPVRFGKRCGAGAAVPR